MRESELLPLRRIRTLKRLCFLSKNGLRSLPTSTRKQKEVYLSSAGFRVGKEKSS